MFVVDTSKTGTWQWDFKAGEFRQRILNPDYKWPWLPYHRHIGDPAQQIGRLYAPVTPDTFNQRILGSFVTAPNSVKSNVPRNYFDKLKLERSSLSDVIGLQEDTAQTLDLGGVIRRFK